MQYLLYVLVVITILIAVAYLPVTETLDFPKGDDEKVLVPWDDQYCENQGLVKAYPGQICCHKGDCDYFRNCRCKDPKTGSCKECWPPITLNQIS